MMLGTLRDLIGKKQEMKYIIRKRAVSQ